MNPKSILAFTTLALILISSSTFTYATEEGGGSSGNGGDTMACEGKPLQFYDLFEAPYHDIKIKPLQSSTFEGSLKEIQTRFKRLDPVRYRLLFEPDVPREIRDSLVKTRYSYETTFNNSLGIAFINDLLKTEQLLLQGITDAKSINPELKVITFFDADLKDHPDEGLVPIPENCSIHQLFIQYGKKDRNGFRREFVGSLNRWKELSPHHKAFATLHEILYSEARFLGHETSEDVRLFNQLVASDSKRSEYISRVLKNKRVYIESHLDLLYEINKITLETIDGQIFFRLTNGNSPNFPPYQLVRNFKHGSFKLNLAHLYFSDDDEILKAADYTLAIHALRKRSDLWLDPFIIPIANTALHWSSKLCIERTSKTDFADRENHYLFDEASKLRHVTDPCIKEVMQGSASIQSFQFSLSQSQVIDTSAPAETFRKALERIMFESTQGELK